MSKHEKLERLFNMLTWHGFVSSEQVSCHLNVLLATSSQRQSKEGFFRVKAELERYQELEALKKTYESILEDQIYDFWGEYGDTESVIEGIKIIVKLNDDDTVRAHLQHPY